MQARTAALPERPELTAGDRRNPNRPRPFWHGSGTPARRWNLALILDRCRLPARILAMGMGGAVSDSTRRRCVSGGALVAVALAAVAGCGAVSAATGDAVDMPAAGPSDSGPGTGGKGGSGGPGGKAGKDGADGHGAADLAGLDSALAACITRNDEALARGWGRWDSPGALAVSEAVQERLQFGDYPGSETLLHRGFIEVSADSANSRMIVVVDPQLVDRQKLSRELNKLAQRTYRASGSAGAPITVDVQAGCFRARELEKVQNYVRDNWGRLQAFAYGSGPGLDSRVHWVLYDDSREVGEMLERKFGAKIAIGYVPRPDKHSMAF